MDSYEVRKGHELAEHTKAWRYVRCYDRYRSKHVVECVYCGTQKKVQGFRNISACATCQRRHNEQLREQAKHKVCAVCGAEFANRKRSALYCCAKCKQKAKEARHIEQVRERRRVHKRLREANAKGNGYIDYSITLAKLIERDGHICKLCGREVNEHDYVYVGDTFVAGNDYPSIDHIKPLSKGGLHQWNNVQLAHRLCNAIKNDKE